MKNSPSQQQRAWNLLINARNRARDESNANRRNKEVEGDAAAECRAYGTRRRIDDLHSAHLLSEWATGPKLSSPGESPWLRRPMPPGANLLFAGSVLSSRRPLIPHRTQEDLSRVISTGSAIASAGADELFSPSQMPKSSWGTIAFRYICIT